MKKTLYWKSVALGLLGVVAVTCLHKENEDANRRDHESKPSYLQYVIPACTKMPGSDRDPCAKRATPHLDSPATTIGYPEIPAYWNLYYDPNKELSIFVTHLVIRGTYIPATTRCEIYDRVFAKYLDFSLPQNYYMLGCYTDVRINDYLVGDGPPELSVQSDTLPILYEEGDNLDWVDGHRDHVAKAYEGREGIMFLAPSSTTVVEAWWAFEFWDVQRKGDKVVVVAPFKEHLEQRGFVAIGGEVGGESRPLTSEELALLEMQLAEFEKVIANGAVARTTETKGRIGVGEHFPMLITDANLLRPYYEGPGVGIVYETDAPAKPPPAPD